MKKTLLLSAIAVLSLCGCQKSTKLTPVNFENVKIEGELAQRIARNFDRLETPLYQPAQVYWTEQQSGGWPADKEGRTILALVLDARASSRTPLYLDSLITMLPEHLNEQGYLGTIHKSVDEQQLSGHGWLLRGLCEYYEWKGDKSVLKIADGIVNNLFLPITNHVDTYPIKPDERKKNVGEMSGATLATINGWRLSSDIGCVFIGMDGLIHYYKHNRKPEIKTLIDKLINLYLSIDLVGIQAQTHASLTALRGIIRYADITNDYSLLPEVEKRWQLYKNFGMTENNENYNWFARYDTWTEPCAVVDSYMVAVHLWQATRNPQYLADAEQIYYNGICVEQRSNGGFGCDKPVGHVHNHISINADEAHWCCTMRGGEGLARVAEYAYFTAADTIFVPFFHASKLSLSNRNITLTQKSDYPFGNNVEFIFEQAPDCPITLAIISPAGTNINAIELNGNEITPENQNGFMIFNRQFAPNDKLTIAYTPVANIISATCDSTRLKATYGPLTLAASSGCTHIILTADATLRPTNTPTEFTVTTHNILPSDSTQITLTPLYHLLSPEVHSSASYHRQVLFQSKKFENTNTIE